MQLNHIIASIVFDCPLSTLRFDSLYSTCSRPQTSEIIDRCVARLRDDDDDEQHLSVEKLAQYEAMELCVSVCVREFQDGLSAKCIKLSTRSRRRSETKRKWNNKRQNERNERDEEKRVRSRKRRREKKKAEIKIKKKKRNESNEAFSVAFNRITVGPVTDRMDRMDWMNLMMETRKERSVSAAAASKTTERNVKQKKLKFEQIKRDILPFISNSFGRLQQKPIRTYTT